ncbi:MAG: RICIN domain-containing protein [Eggerthellaceae bacterium]|nr:RICIN domain-containing protein [Eggerthellaceae bacterium]
MLKTCGSKLACLMVFIAITLLVMPATALADDGSLQVGVAANNAATSVAKGVAKKAKFAFTKQTVKMDLDSSKSMVVTNGTYYIASGANTTSVACAKGKNAVMRNVGTKKTEKWKLTFDKAAQAYYIVNTKTGRYLTVSGSKAKNKANVSMAKKVKASASKKTDGELLQQWRITAAATGYRLYSVANPKLFLTISNDNLIVAKAGKGIQKFWLLKKAGQKFLRGGTYTLSNGKGKLLSVPRDSISVGKKLAMRSNQSTLGQVFDVEYVSNGNYRIRNVNSGQYVTAAGKKVFQQPLGNKKTVKKRGQKTAVYRGKNRAQLWKATLLPDGKVQFKNKKTRKLLTVGGCTDWKISPSVSGINAIGKKALWKANTRTSRTKWCIVADLTWHELFVFEKANPNTEGGPWKLYDTWRIASGSRGNWTSAKDNYVSHHTFTFGGFNCFYWTHLTGSGFFHSVLYASSSYPNRITDGRLGMYISHGCMRMKLENAKWIYENCHSGTAVSRYY